MAGISINARMLLPVLPFLFSFPSESINRSIPLFLNSYLPLVAIRKVFFENLVFNNNSDILINLFLADARLLLYSLSLGTNISSNPFGVIKSTFLFKKWLHSFAVISLTVVKASAFCADNSSSDCFDIMLNSFAISSEL